MASDAINCKFPMRAVGKVECDGVEYAAGEDFDAGSQKSRNFLLHHGAAVERPTPTPTGTVKRKLRGVRNGKP